MRIVFLVSLLSTACVWAAPLSPGQTLKREALFQLEEIEGLWTELGVACINITSGKILKFVDTWGPSNKFTVDSQSHQFFESRGPTGWQDNPLATSYSGNGFIEFNNSKIVITYLTHECASPTPEFCGQYYETKMVQPFWINQELLGLLKQNGLPYFRCNLFPYAGALILYSRNLSS